MRYPFWRVGVFIATAIWPLWWFYQAFEDLLGPDPGKVLVDRLGLGTLVLLLITLSMKSSRTEHEKLCLNMGGPSSKAKYY